MLLCLVVLYIFNFVNTRKTYRFTNEDDRTWFASTVEQTAENVLEEDFQFFVLEETYFVDFLRDMPEATGDEPDDYVVVMPKVYEEIPRYYRN